MPERPRPNPVGPEGRPTGRFRELRRRLKSYWSASGPSEPRGSEPPRPGPTQGPYPSIEGNTGPSPYGSGPGSADSDWSRGARYSRPSDEVGSGGGPTPGGQSKSENTGSDPRPARGGRRDTPDEGNTGDTGGTTGGGESIDPPTPPIGLPSAEVGSGDDDSSEGRVIPGNPRTEPRSPLLSAWKERALWTGNTIRRPVEAWRERTQPFDEETKERWSLRRDSLKEQADTRTTTTIGEKVGFGTVTAAGGAGLIGLDTALSIDPDPKVIVATLGVVTAGAVGVWFKELVDGWRNRLHHNQKLSRHAKMAAFEAGTIATGEALADAADIAPNAVVLGGLLFAAGTAAVAKGIHHQIVNYEANHHIAKLKTKEALARDHRRVQGF